MYNIYFYRFGVGRQPYLVHHFKLPTYWLSCVYINFIRKVNPMLKNTQAFINPGPPGLWKPLDKQGT